MTPDIVGPLASYESEHPVAAILLFAVTFCLYAEETLRAASFSYCSSLGMNTQIFCSLAAHSDYWQTEDEQAAESTPLVST